MHGMCVCNASNIRAFHLDLVDEVNASLVRAANESLPPPSQQPQTQIDARKESAAAVRPSVRNRES